MACSICGQPLSGTRGICRRCESALVAGSERESELTSHERNRQRLESEIEAFLASGGRIQQLEPTAKAAPRDPFRGAGGTVVRPRG